MLITYVFCLVICIGKVVSRRACGWRTRQFSHLQPPFLLQILPRKSIKSFFLAFVVLVDISRSCPMHTRFLFFLDFPCVSAVFSRGNASSLILIYCVKAVPWSSYTNHSAAEPPPRRAMAPPSVDNGKVKKDITKLPWHCAHHNIRVIYTVNGMLLCLGYGCSSASPPLNIVL